MALDRITLWTLEGDFADPEYFGKVDIGGASTLEALRVTLESNDVLEWPFEFWDTEDKRRVRKKLERLNAFSKDVYVIQAKEDLNEGNKRRRLRDGSFTVTAVEIPPLSDNSLDVQEDVATATSLPAGSSRVSAIADSAEVTDTPLKSTLLPLDVMDRYLERAKKLRAELQKVAMSDHEWWLKSFDLNGAGVVKLWCGECKKDCGGGSKDHTKAQIDNLFNNFKRSHIISIAHVRNFCAAKNVNFDDHPQSEAKNGRSLTLTPHDHKRMINEGVQIVEDVNSSLPDDHKKFTILGNLTADDTRCYWFKVKCPYCREMMVLCPPKKTLEVNLRSHIAGPKHLRQFRMLNRLLASQQGQVDRGGHLGQAPRARTPIRLTCTVGLERLHQTPREVRTIPLIEIALLPSCVMDTVVQLLSMVGMCML